MVSAVQPQPRKIVPPDKTDKARPKLRIVKSFPDHKIDLSLFLEGPAGSKANVPERKEPDKKEDKGREYVLKLGERINKGDEKKKDLTEGDIMNSLCG